MPAEKLQLYDEVELSDGTHALIENLWHEKTGEEIPVYNMEVEDFHTYYIAKTGVLVHNDGECGHSGGKVRISSKSGSNTINNVSKASPFDLQATHSQTLSKKNMNKLIDDIKNNGISETIKYVEYNGQKYVVDGHHRLIAAKRLGLGEVPIEQVELPYTGYKTIEDLLWFD